MSALQDFIDNARKKNFSDDEIKQHLINSGWNEDEVAATLGNQAKVDKLGDLEVPRPENKSAENQPTPPSISKQEKSVKTSIHSLHAAILHVLLWFFIVSSSVSIGSVFSVFFNERYSDEGALTTLSTMIAVVLVTFIPYAVFYYLYVKKLKSNPEIIPSTVWSIITICLHSIAAMIAAITVVVQLVAGGSLAVLFSAILILLIVAIVITTFAFAAFIKPSNNLRKPILLFSPVVLALIMALLFIFSLADLPNAKADVEMRRSMASAVVKVRDYTAKNQALPLNSSQLNLDTGVTYNKKQANTYEICGTFKKKTSDRPSYTSRENLEPANDGLVSEDALYYVNATAQDPCKEFTSDELRNQSNNSDFYNQLEKQKLQMNRIDL
jgi:hypothetical protein